MQLRRQLAVELTKVSVRTGRRSDLLMGLLWQTVDAYSAGDRHAGRLRNELLDPLDDRGHLAVGFVTSAIEVMLTIRSGRLGDAWWSAAQLVTIRWCQGRLVELLPMLRDLAYSPALSVVDDSAVVALAVAAALDGDHQTAASSLAALCGGSGDAPLAGDDERHRGGRLPAPGRGSPRWPRGSWTGRWITCTRRCSTTSMKRARGVVLELPGSTRLGPATGLWHQIPAGQETLRVHRRFFKDLEAADTASVAA